MKNPVIALLESQAAFRCTWVMVAVGLTLKLLFLAFGAPDPAPIYLDPK